MLLIETGALLLNDDHITNLQLHSKYELEQIWISNFINTNVDTAKIALEHFLNIFIYLGIRSPN